MRRGSEDVMDAEFPIAWVCNMLRGTSHEWTTSLITFSHFRSFFNLIILSARDSWRTHIIWTLLRRLWRETLVLNLLKSMRKLWLRIRRESLNLLVCIVALAVASIGILFYNRNSDWVAISAYGLQLDVITKVSSRYFVGEPLCTFLNMLSPHILTSISFFFAVFSLFIPTGRNAELRAICEKAAIELFKSSFVRWAPAFLRGW